jgi:hypothetical protein
MLSEAQTREHAAPIVKRLGCAAPSVRWAGDRPSNAGQHTGTLSVHPPDDYVGQSLAPPKAYRIGIANTLCLVSEAGFISWLENRLASLPSENRPNQVPNQQTSQNRRQNYLPDRNDKGYPGV